MDQYIVNNINQKYGITFDERTWFLKFSETTCVDNFVQNYPTTNNLRTVYSYGKRIIHFT